jgi:hypothetical protein
MTELLRAKPISRDSTHGRPLLNANRGFLELFLYKGEKQLESFQILYTTYDGVIIIRNLNDCYKNDDLEMAAMMIIPGNR